MNKKVDGQNEWDSVLLEEGIKQAELAAKRLKDEKIEFVFSSDYRRTMDTAKIILKVTFILEKIQ